jgi:cation transport ATPase
MNVDSSYVHALEGRLRIKIPKVKGAADQAQEVERHLRQFAGVEHVSANPVTGNVLILYNPRLTAQENIISALTELGYLSQFSSAVARRTGSHSIQAGVVEKVTATVTASLMEIALTRLVSALI